MKLLTKEDIDKVRPKFRQMVISAWDRGEDVPYDIVNLSDAPLSEKDIEWAKQLCKDFKIKDK